jgi:hypothetical protein
VAHRNGTRKGSGRVTPRKDAGAPAGTGGRKDAIRKAMSNEKWDVSESRSVRSGWIWRGFLFLSLFGIGIAIIMDANHHGSLAVLWLVIAAGWFATAMWLWRQHSRYMRGD